MENLKLLFQLYLRPASAMSDIMDKGSWMFAAMAVLVISIVFFATVNQKLHEAYSIPVLSEYYSSDIGQDFDSPAAEAEYKLALENYQASLQARQKVPI